MQINIKYHYQNMTKIEKFDDGDWIDLRCVGVTKITTKSIFDYEDGFTNLPVLRRETAKEKLEWKSGLVEFEEGFFEKAHYIPYSKGDYLWLNLGVSIQLPEGYEAHVVPRSSTFKTYSIIQTNHIGIIDESYCGNDDIWIMPVLAMEDGFIICDERVCQMRIDKKMPSVQFNIVEDLGNANRGGLGHSGTK